MNEFEISQFSVSSSFELSSYLLMLLGASFLGYLLSAHYSRYFPYVSRSQSMNKAILTISIITFLIISVVKSSLALSLGLVGALSIIRFRTPIKEPFELAYLFIAISIGLGFGANQWLPTTIVVFFVMALLTFLSKHGRHDKGDIFYFYLNFDKDFSVQDLERALKNLSLTSTFNIDIKRFDNSKDFSQVTLVSNVATKTELVELSGLLEKTLIPSSFSVVDGNKLSPF